MKDKKRNKIVIVIAIILFVITITGVVIGTYALYRQTYSGNGTVSTSEWSVKLYKNSSNTEVNNLNFTMSDITWDTHNGKNNSIAPGDSGYIDFTIDASGSEVDVEYNVTVGAITNAPATGFTATANPSTGSIYYATGANAMRQTIRITVTWDASIYDSSSKDTSDITAANNSMTIPVTITLNQALTPSYFAYGNPTTSSTTEYASLNKNLFVSLKGTQKSVCIIRNGAVHCFKSNDNSEEDHIFEVLPEAMCNTNTNTKTTTCYADDFSCTVAKKSGYCPTPDNCIISSYGYVRCHDNTTGDECTISNENDAVTCS